VTANTPPSTDATGIDQTELEMLVSLAGSLFSEAKVTARVGGWRSAIVLIGASIETGLLATVGCLEHELRTRQLWPKRPLQKLGLVELVGIAVQAGWLPESATPDTTIAEPGLLTNGTLGDAIDFIRLMRNALMHPGRHLSDFAWLDSASEEQMRPTYELCEGIAGEVFARLEVTIVDDHRSSSLGKLVPHDHNN
jgi:hypothetical protein